MIFFNTFTDGGIFGPFQQLLRAANSGVLSASNYGAVTLGANPNLPIGGYSHLRVDTVKETHCDALSAGLKVTTMKIAWLQIWKTTHFSSNFLRQCVDTMSPAQLCLCSYFVIRKACMPCNVFPVLYPLIDIQNTFGPCTLLKTFIH